jgi:hypothetical protein
VHVKLPVKQGSAHVSKLDKLATVDVKNETTNV